MLNKIYEHLITKKKYNTLKLKYKIKNDEYEEKVIEVDAQKRINRSERNQYEERIREYIEELSKKEEEISKLKKKLKEKKDEKEIKTKTVG